MLEDFDHLYRYADLLQGEQGVYAEKLVGRYTEIMPGRPTISHHRYPIDNVRRIVSYKTADVRTVLATMTITAAEQQTMNYYMNVANFALTDMGRRLYEEIALVEEEHVTQYEDLTDSTATWLEMLLWHEYNECYLYWSCYMTETDRYIKELWEENFAMEISHLHKAAELLKKYEGKDWQEVIGDGEFPEPLSLHEISPMCVRCWGTRCSSPRRGRITCASNGFPKTPIFPLSKYRQSDDGYRALA